MSIESEDSSQHSSGSNDDGDDASSLEDSAPTKSVKGKQLAVASTNVKVKLKKPMTARQAVLASVCGGVSSHITLCELLSFLSLLSFGFVSPSIVPRRNRGCTSYGLGLEMAGRITSKEAY